MIIHNTLQQHRTQFLTLFSVSLMGGQHLYWVAQSGTSADWKVR